MLPKKNGAGILYLVTAERPSERYGILGKSRNRDEWEIPGGKQDPDDKSIIHAAARESVEEFGLDPSFHNKLVKFITTYPFSVSIHYPRGSYVLFIVKLKTFDFKKANEAAQNRLRVFEMLDQFSQDKLRTLVEMKEYGKINMWRELAGKHQFVKGSPIRHRDAFLLHRDDLITKVYELSKNDNIPTFDEEFQFINFDKLKN